MKRSRLARSRSRRLSLGWERLEVRRVLDASAMPMWDQMPEMAGQALTLDVGFTATAAAQSGDFTYTTSNGAVTITSYTGAGGAVEIPAAIGGLPVTAIGDSAFTNKTTLTSISIPSTVASIGYSAFSNCTKLTGVTIPAIVTYIGSNAFSNCTSLQAVTIPAGVTRIYAATFYNCIGLTSVSIPDGVTSIDSESFSICTGLTSLTIPVGVTAIADSAFSNCTGLTSVTIPNGVLTIGSNAFFNCSSLQSVTIPGSVRTVGSYVFSGCTALTTATIQPRVGWYPSVSIENNMFSNCTSLSSVTIPSGVTTVGDSAFANCIGLTGVVLPASVTTVGKSAFQYCKALTNVTLNAVTMSIGANAFSNCSSLKNIYVWGNAPSTNPSAFTSSPITVNRRDGTSGWSTTLAGAPVVLFGAEFRYSVSNYELTITGYTGAGGVVTIPTQLPTELGCLPVSLIGNKAFRSKTSVTDVAIPSGVRGIGSSAFEGCTSLTTVTIPAGVTTIGSAAFGGCTLLTAIAVDASNPAYASVNGALYDKSLSTLIQYPAGRTGSVEIPVAITSIGTSAFSDCNAITSVSIPVTVTSIGDNAFYWCNRLTEVSIPTGVTSIGSSAFHYCTRLTSILIPNGVTSIGDYAFYGCYGLMSVTIPASVTSIGGSTFLVCSPLVFRAITVDAANPAYASVDGVLYDKSLSTLITYPTGKKGSAVIPTTVTSIGKSAFYYCPFLESVYFFAAAPTVAGGTLDRYPFWFPTTPFTVYRPTSATGWSSTFADHPVEIFQPVDVPAGQITAVLIASDASKVVKKGAGTAILSTASTRTGGTVVEAGELVVRNKGALGVGLLEVQAGAKATFQTGYDTVAVTSLALADTSRLEIGTSKLTVTANDFTESDIRTKLISGRNGGSWDGPSGITSTFAGGDRSIGYRVADGALEVAYAAPGDSNLDGVIDILDIGDILAAGKFNTGEPANWQQGDVNYDDVFDIVDLADILGTNLFNQGTYLTQASATSAAADAGSVATFDQALVFAALAMDSGQQTSTTKRKSF